MLKKFFATTLTIAMLVLTMMPLTPVYAETSADWQAKMNEAQQRINQYSAQLESDQAALNTATANLESAESALNTAQEALDAAEYALNLKSSDFLYSKIKQAWPNDVARLKSFDNSRFNQYSNMVSNFETQGYIMYSDDYLINKVNNANNSLIKSVLSAYNSKYGPDAFKKSFIDTQGYFNTLEALDNIDRCNAIRANPSELANFYVNVLGQSVPSNIPQLRISPYLMKISAMNVTLNGTGKIAHIYGAVTNYGDTGITGVTAKGQNVAGGKFGDNTQIVNPFEAWWNTENHNGTISHNKTLSNPDYTMTGFAISNPNKITGIAVAGQDFINPATTGYTSYTTAEYRSGLKSYCATEYSTYNSKLTAYNNVKSAYNTAKSNYNTAKSTYDTTANALATAKADYNRYEEYYQAALNDEQSTTYTIKFRDGLTDELLLQKTVTKGSSVTPPTPLTHSGYTFTGWDSDLYMNVTKSYTIVALYTPNNTGGNNDSGGNTGGDDSGMTLDGTTTDPTTTYTVKFKDGLTYLIFDKKTVAEGSSVVPPTPPTHDGYKFDKWDSDAYQNVTGDKTITALYTKVSPSVSKINLSKAGYVKASKSSFTYGGKAITPTSYIVPYYKDNALKEQKFAPCKVTYKNNNAIGTATIIFSPPTDAANAAYADQFTGSITYTYKIVPAKPGFKTAKMTKNKAVLTIKTVSGGVGYQYQYKKNSTKKWSKTYSTSGSSIAIKKLKKNTKYNFRIRAYKKGTDGRTYYSSWTTIKPKTTKKGSKTYKY